MYDGGFVSWSYFKMLFCLYHTRDLSGTSRKQTLIDLFIRKSQK